jgi:ribosomal protein S18 acetylase RimI-like enzyme
LQEAEQRKLTLTEAATPREDRAMPVATRKARPTEFPTLATVLARAFADDPVMAWCFPNADRRLARLERFFRVLDLGGPFGRADEVDTTEGLGAVAIWTPPGQWRVGVLDEVRMLPAILRIATPRWAPSRLAGFNKMEQCHPHEPPHWYLATIGTDPTSQGRGLGSALLTDRLGRLDAEGMPSYLESTKESNVPFYERHGFAVTRTFDLPRGPRLWLMWRDPQ